MEHLCLVVGTGRLGTMQRPSEQQRGMLDLGGLLARGTTSKSRSATSNEERDLLEAQLEFEMYILEPGELESEC